MSTMNADDEPLDIATLEKNEDGTYDVIVRMTVRLNDEVGLRVSFLETEQEFSIDSSHWMLGYAVSQYLLGQDPAVLRVERGRVFALQRDAGKFENVGPDGGEPIAEQHD